MSKIKFVTDDISYVLGGLDCSSGTCTNKLRIYASYDGGPSWTDETPSNLKETTLTAYDIAMSPNDTLFISASAGVILKKNQHHFIK